MSSLSKTGPTIGFYEFVDSLDSPPIQSPSLNNLNLDVRPSTYDIGRRCPLPPNAQMASPMTLPQMKPQPLSNAQMVSAMSALSMNREPSTSASTTSNSVTSDEDQGPIQQAASWKTNNRLFQTVANISLKYGYNPLVVVPHFRALASTDFCFGSPRWDRIYEAIPGAVWKEVVDHYNLSRQKPYRRLTAECHPTVFKEKSPVFVARKYTEELVRDQVTMEHFSTAQRLYQYLNWTMRINKVSRTMNLLEGRNGGRALLINTELHDQKRRELYALCIPNDVVSPKAQRWQLAALCTASELSRALGIDYHHFPRGVRACSPQFERYRMLRSSCPNERGVSSLKALKALIRERDSKRKMIRYQQVKCVLAGSGRNSKRKTVPENVLTVHLSEFYSKVRAALNDPEVELIPMVSIVSRRTYQRKEEDFSVDYLLPVSLGQDWVGVVYRDMEPIMALMDIYDITNKAILCDPSMNPDDVPFRGGPYNRLKILPDSKWDLKSTEWVMMYSNAYYEQFGPKKTHLVPSNYHKQQPAQY